MKDTTQFTFTSQKAYTAKAKELGCVDRYGRLYKTTNLSKPVGFGGKVERGFYYFNIDNSAL